MQKFHANVSLALYNKTHVLCVYRVCISIDCHMLWRCLHVLLDFFSRSSRKPAFREYHWEIAKNVHILCLRQLNSQLHEATQKSKRKQQQQQHKHIEYKYITMLFWLAHKNLNICTHTRSKNTDCQIDRQRIRLEKPILVLNNPLSMHSNLLQPIKIKNGRCKWAEDEGLSERNIK